MKYEIKRVLKADLDSVQIRIDGKDWAFLDIMGAFDDVSTMSSTVGDTEFSIFVNCQFVIQAVSGSANISLGTIDSTGQVALRNFTASTYPMFEAGRTYLLLVTAGAITDIIPNPVATALISNVGDISLGILSARRYAYTAVANISPMNATSFDCITFDIDKAAAASNAAVRKARKDMELRLLLQA